MADDLKDAIKQKAEGPKSERRQGRHGAGGVGEVEVGVDVRPPSPRLRSTGRQADVAVRRAHGPERGRRWTLRSYVDELNEEDVAVARRVRVA